MITSMAMNVLSSSPDHIPGGIKAIGAWTVMITLSQKPQCLLYVILALNIVRHNMKGSHDHVPQMPGA